MARRLQIPYPCSPDTINATSDRANVLRGWLPRSKWRFERAVAAGALLRSIAAGHGRSASTNGHLREAVATKLEANWRREFTDVQSVLTSAHPGIGAGGWRRVSWGPVHLQPLLGPLGRLQGFCSDIEENSPGRLTDERCAVSPFQRSPYSPPSLGIIEQHRLEMNARIAKILLPLDSASPAR